MGGLCYLSEIVIDMQVLIVEGDELSDCIIPSSKPGTWLNSSALQQRLLSIRCWRPSLGDSFGHRDRADLEKSILQKLSG